MTIHVTLEGLQQFLQQKQFPAEIDEKSKQITSSLPIGGQDYPLFVKVDSNMVQLILFIPYAMNPQTVNDVARLLHYLNKEIDMPGFGMDETARAIFYRCSLPTTHGQIDPALLDTLLAAFPKIGYAFFPTILAIANGNTRFENILKKLKKT